MDSAPETPLAGAVPRLAAGCGTGKNRGEPGNSAPSSGVPLPCPIGWRPVSSDVATGISNARHREVMLGSISGWQSWYEMCTKRAIMRPRASVFRLTIRSERAAANPGRIHPR